MMKSALGATATILIACLPQQAAAQVAVEGNVARADSEWGAELGVGYSLKSSGFAIRPMGGVLIYQGDNDRYYDDDIGGGDTRCRDRTSGQFADDDKCNNTAVKAYAKLEATYTLLGSAEFGLGARYSGDDVQPYGMVSFPVAPRIRIKANAGDDYYALGLRADF
tara:strand:+ start:723 stop:1217 length:495 start_codon:yes stop_codon:yes gene_type:complete